MSYFMIPTRIKSVYYDILYHKCHLSKPSFAWPCVVALQYNGVCVVRRYIYKDHIQYDYTPEFIYLKYGIFK